VHLDPDGLLTPKDIREIEKVKQDIKSDRENGTNKMGEIIASDMRQLQDKLNQKRKDLE
jgi:hypothetical protein